MSEYSEQYTIQDLKSMGEKNAKHVLGEEKYQQFHDEVVSPKPKHTTAQHHQTHPTTTKLSTTTKWAASDDDDNDKDDNDKEKAKKRSSAK